MYNKIMRKWFITLCFILAFGLLSCSNDDNINEHTTECLVDVVFDKMVPQYGECYRIINYDDFGADVQEHLEGKYKNASTYEIFFKDLPVEGFESLYFLEDVLQKQIELEHISRDGKEITYTPIDNGINMYSTDEFVIRSATDIIYINEAGLEINCRCEGHNEKARIIGKADNIDCLPEV